MGEYADYKGKRIYIGVCEGMTQLRAEDAPLVKKVPNSLDPIAAADGIRFRFPFPDEDGMEPGSYADSDRGVNVPGLDCPTDVHHYSVQFVKGNGGGYLVSLPCPQSGEKVEGARIARNGGQAGINIAQQKVVDGHLALVAECAVCGSMWRYPTLDDAAEVLNHINRLVEQNRPTGDEYADRYRSQTAADRWAALGGRILAGYINPPAWVTARRKATSAA